MWFKKIKKKCFFLFPVSFILCILSGKTRKWECSVRNQNYYMFYLLSLKFLLLLWEYHTVHFYYIFWRWATGYSSVSESYTGWSGDEKIKKIDRKSGVRRSCTNCALFKASLLGSVTSYRLFQGEKQNEVSKNYHSTRWSQWEANQAM